MQYDFSLIPIEASRGAKPEVSQLSQRESQVRMLHRPHNVEDLGNFAPLSSFHNKLNKAPTCTHFRCQINEAHRAVRK